MTITVVTPADWRLEPPAPGLSHPAMMINPAGPHLRILDSEPHFYTPPHSHSEPEVMIVLQGRLLFNGQWCESGTVVYVPANEDYWHTTGAERCVVALMRPAGMGNFRATLEAVAAQ